MSKGILVADACDADRVPDFVPANRRDRLRTEIPQRLFTFTLRGERSRYLHILVLRNGAGAPLTVTPQNRCVYWVSCSNIAAPRARRLLKRVRAVAWRTAALAQLAADNTAIGTAVKASPDLRRPLTFDGSGNPLTYELALMHTVLGFQHPTEAASTTSAEVDGAIAEAL